MITSNVFHELADQSTNVNRIVAFKVKQGVEFLASVCEHKSHPGLEGGPADGPTIQLEKIRLMDVQMDNHGRMMGKLIPFSNSNPDAEMTFSLSEVLAVYTPSNDVEQDYIQSTTAIDLAGAV
ncbi:MAG: hypothetical protein JXR12_01245 [Neptunomonas phycophila]|uniref:hypothetical protein n=1 Tax=Neptunomonas phycophila TaxID=1572645 RepID=UPI003B8E6DD1